MEKQSTEDYDEVQDIGDIETEIDGYEDDPEIQALKKQIEAESAKVAGHKREKTIDLEKRLEQQIAEITNNAPEKGGEGKALIEANPELYNLYKDIDEKYKIEMDELWGKYVEDTKVEKIERVTDFSEVHKAIMNNPFLKKIIKSSDPQNKGVTSIKCFIKDNYTLPKSLLYDLLTEKLNIHSACVPDYALRRMLAENEPKLKLKYSHLIKIGTRKKQ